MGLDGVELVMAVEDRFGVKLPDSECSRVRTVADLAALVIAKLPRTSESPCPSAHEFYALRRLFTGTGIFKHAAVRPAARLEDLFNVHRSRDWAMLRRHDRRLPPLHLSGRVDGMMLWAAGLGMFVMLVGSGIVYSRFGAWAVLGYAALWSTLIAACYGLIALVFHREFPPGLITVADLVRAVMPIEIPAENSGRRLVAQQRVLEEVRRLTSEQLGIPIEKVKPESDFVRDLHLD